MRSPWTKIFIAIHQNIKNKGVREGEREFYMSSKTSLFLNYIIDILYIYRMGEGEHNLCF